MTIIALPAAGLSDIKWTPPAPHAQRNRSEWTGATQIAEFGAGRWTAEAAVVPLWLEANILPWRAFAAQLRGIVNSFRLVAVEGPQRRIGPNPVVSAAAAAGGRALPLSGMVANGLHLRAGQLMTIRLAGDDEQLVTLVAPIVADAAGTAVASIGEPLRRAATAGVAAETVRPWALMRMVDDQQLGWAVTRGQSYSVGFKCEEAF